jgi:signal transduction histidine kinase
MQTALLPPVEASPRRPTRPRRANSQHDTFLIEYEFDIWIVIVMGLCVEYDNWWNMIEQLHEASRFHGRTRAVSLVVADLFSKAILWIGVRTYLQHLVRKQQISSRWARLVIVAGVLLEATCEGMLVAYNFGLTELRGPSKPALHTPQTFLWYFYSTSHLSAGAVGWQLAARILTLVAVGQLMAPFMVINVWQKLALGLPPFDGVPYATYAIVSYWSAKSVLLLSSLLFTFILQRFRKALAEAQELQARRSLSQVMFHELRNPLNGTVGHLALAQAAYRESPASQAVVSHQADAQTCTEHALRVLRTLNALEKYSEQGWPVSLRATDLLAVFTDVVTMVQPAIAAGVELRHSVTFQRGPGSGHLQQQPSDRFMVWIDDLVLREVLLNLVQNSARFTTSGLIELGCVIARADQCVDVDGGGGGTPTDEARCCHFFVRDTGTGIHSEALASLFTKYASIGGVGIGVHLSRRQVEAMGGELVVRSPWSAGRTGTEISFELEIEPARAETNSVHVSPPLPPTLPPTLRVLIADDVTMNLRLLQAALKRVGGGGWRVTAVEVAGEALTHFEAGRRDGDAFDLIIMDEHFDARSASVLGTDVIRQIRATENESGGGRRAAIISCSGNVEDCSDTSSFFASGADDVWQKPYPSFTDGTLQRRLRDVIA